MHLKPMNNQMKHRKTLLSLLFTNLLFVAPDILAQEEGLNGSGTGLVAAAATNNMSAAACIGQPPVDPEDPSVINVLYNGVSQDGSDQSIEFESLLSSANNGKRIFLPNGVYSLEENIDIGNLTNMIVEGESKSGTILETTSEKIFNITGSLTNVAFKNITLRSTNTTTTVSGGQYALFYSNGNAIDGLLLADLYLTAPGVSTNGIKFIQEGLEVAKNIVVDSITVENIGRMGLETQNHVPSNEAPRFQGFTVVNSSFNSTGLKEHGMGVSFSGWLKDLRVKDNVFENCPSRGMEFLATEGAVVTGNTGTNNLLFSAFTRNPNVTLRPSKDIIYSNNTSNGSIGYENGAGFRSVEDLTMKNNSFNEILGTILFEDVSDAYLSNNTIDTASYAGIVTRNLTRFAIHGGKIKNSRNGNSLIRIESDSTDFSLHNVDLSKALGQQPYRFFGGAASVPEFYNCRRYDENDIYQEIVNTY